MNKNNDKIEKLIIIGSGPAGYTAAIYAARANLTPLLITGLIEGGQLMTTLDVENYPGFSNKQTGPNLMEEMKNQALNFGTSLRLGIVVGVDLKSKPFKLYLEDGSELLTLSIIVATGANARWLGIEGESRLTGSGVSACATCDGFFFKNQVVAVIGGGNTALEEALYLTKHAEKVYLIHRRDTFRAEKILKDRVLNNQKIEILFNKVVVEFCGKNKLESLSLLETVAKKEPKTTNIKLDGAFVAIGHDPATNIFKGSLDLDTEGYIKIFGSNLQTSTKGVFAAGDVCDKIYRQAVTAAAQGCIAAIEVEKYLEKNKFEIN